MKLITEQIHSLSGLKLHIVQTNKFKTNTIVLKLKAPLDEDDVTLRSLLAHVLQNGTESYPTSTKLRSHLDNLYGATLNVDLSKKGEDHIITFRMDVANEKYLSDSTPLLRDAIGLLGEMLLKPALEGNAFQKNTVEKEKRALKQRIQSVFDDKMRYSSHRLIEEMCKEEPYRLPANGMKEKVDEITAEALYKFYKESLPANKIHLYIVGDIKEDEVVDAVSSVFTMEKSDASMRNANKTNKELKEENEVIEKQDVKQGKLNIGFRTNITFNDPLYYALQVGNGIFGGFSHSKLFINVREKESLAYYAASRVESHKGLLLVMSGVDSSNYEKAVTIIKEQMSAMQNGVFTEEEISQTKAVIKNQLLETIDTPRGLVEVLFNNDSKTEHKELEEVIHGIEKVTKEEIVEACKKFQLDTIYFLTGKEA
ncbi:MULTISPECIES: EF-P 5-aminopentanol modification-associated protein YfmF [Bacillus]|uniref:EF-P 5-aminopentanol modification-associated protein YfmF n=1 Tax=Bacillus TaxID=1386 RepID=UPI000BB8190F|nr:MULTISPECIES: pitrilysin family protein [Bacillus]